MAGIVQNMLQVGETPLNVLHLLLDERKALEGESEAYYDKIPQFGKNDRKSIFVKRFLAAFDTEYTFLQKYIQFVVDEIKPLFPGEDTILVQKTPNIRIHVPENTNIGTRDSDPSSDIIGIHCDSEFHHPKGEINIVLPLTNMFESNGIYFEPVVSSGLHPKDYGSMNMNTNQFFVGNLNVMKHYNRINKTGKTRVSLDFRILPFSRYVSEESKSSVTGNSKFILGDYYMLI
eukprot:g2909.t1